MATELKKTDTALSKAMKNPLAEATKKSDVANAIGIETPAYSHYESDRRDMSTEIQKKLADYFKVSVDYLLNVTDDPQPYS